MRRAHFCRHFCRDSVNARSSYCGGLHAKVDVPILQALLSRQCTQIPFCGGLHAEVDVPIFAGTFSATVVRKKKHVASTGPRAYPGSDPVAMDSRVEATRRVRQACFLLGQPCAGAARVPCITPTPPPLPNNADRSVVTRCPALPCASARPSPLPSPRRRGPTPAPARTQLPTAPVAPPAARN